MYSFSFLRNWSIKIDSGTYAYASLTNSLQRVPVYNKKYIKCYFAWEVRFKVSKLRTHFSQNVLSICCNIFSKIMIIYLRFKHVLTCIIFYVSSFQNGHNHPCNSTSFYFQSATVEGSRQMWNYCFLTFEFFSKCTLSSYLSNQINFFQW